MMLEIWKIIDMIPVDFIFFTRITTDFQLFSGQTRLLPSQGYGFDVFEKFL